MLIGSEIDEASCIKEQKKFGASYSKLPNDKPSSSPLPIIDTNCWERLEIALCPDSPVRGQSADADHGEHPLTCVVHILAVDDAISGAPTTPGPTAGSPPTLSAPLQQMPGGSWHKGKKKFGRVSQLRAGPQGAERLPVGLLGAPELRRHRHLEPMIF